jgi:hypothetical protein
MHQSQTATNQRSSARGLAELDYWKGNEAAKIDLCYSTADDIN